MKEAVEREKLAASKRKEKEEKEKKLHDVEQRQREKLEREKKVAVSSSPSGSTLLSKTGKGKAKVAPNKKPIALAAANGLTQANKAGPVAVAPTRAAPVKNRGWETKGQTVVKPPEPVKAQPKQPVPVPIKQPVAKPQNTTNKGVTRATVTKETPAPAPTPILPPPASTSSAASSTFLAPRPAEFSGNQPAQSSFPQFEKPTNAGVGNGAFSNTRLGQQQAPPDAIRDAFSGGEERVQMSFSVGAVEHPAVVLFRRDKVTELMQRCRLALSVVDEVSLKSVVSLDCSCITQSKLLHGLPDSQLGGL